MKCKLKSVYAVDFEKPVPSIQEVTEIIQELELNQVTKLFCLIQTIPATSDSCERSASSLKHVNEYMRCSQSEEQLCNLIFISINKDLLKRMKVEHGFDTFYNKVINEFARKKQRIELIYR